MCERNCTCEKHSTQSSRISKQEERVRGKQPDLQVAGKKAENEVENAKETDNPFRFQKRSVILSRKRRL